jgi:hypothetical protein
MALDETNIPRYAMFRGRRVRIIDYDPGGLNPFRILDTDDTQRSVARTELTFLKETKK